METLRLRQVCARFFFVFIAAFLASVNISANAQVTPAAFAYKRPALDANGVDVISGMSIGAEPGTGIGVQWGTMEIGRNHAVG